VNTHQFTSGKTLTPHCPLR